MRAPQSPEAHTATVGHTQLPPPQLAVVVRLHHMRTGPFRQHQAATAAAAAERHRRPRRPRWWWPVAAQATLAAAQQLQLAAPTGSARCGCQSSTGSPRESSHSPSHPAEQGLPCRHPEGQPQRNPQLQPGCTPRLRLAHTRRRPHSPPVSTLCPQVGPPGRCSTPFLAAAPRHAPLSVRPTSRKSRRLKPCLAGHHRQASRRQPEPPATGWQVPALRTPHPRSPQQTARPTRTASSQAGRV